MKIACAQNATISTIYLTALVLAGIAFQMGPTAANAQGRQWRWIVSTTQEGCLYRHRSDRSSAEYATLYRLSWSGYACSNGGYINGQGVLSTISVSSGQVLETDEGRFIDGVPDGPVLVSHGRMVNPNVFKMGCVLIRGATRNGCVPRSRISAPPSTRNVAPSAPLKPSASSSAEVRPLRPTAKLEAHNPVNEASQCLELITKKDFERRGVKSVMGAVFNNRCAYPIETRWCVGADRCARLGFDNLATMPARHYRGISYDAPAGVKTETRWAGCRLGFAHRPDFAGTLHYACK